MKKNNFLRITFQVILILVLGYIVGFLLSNYNLLKYKESISNSSLDDKIIRSQNIEFKNGKIFTKGENSSFTINIGKNYINKLLFKYKTESNYEWTLIYSEKDFYGNYKETVKTGISSNKINLFAEKIDNEIREITFVTNTANIEIYGLSQKNSINYLPNLSIIIAIASLAIYILIYFRKIILLKIEYMFLIICIVSGMSIIISMPIAIGTSWDDETHFLNAYGLLNDYHTKATLELYNVPETNYGMFNTEEEQEKYIKHLNDIDREKTEIKTNVGWSYMRISYVPQTIFIKILKIMNFNISSIFALGKIINLITYSIIVFFAIRKIPKCKYLLATIALLPTPVFLASNYSYDPNVTAFIMLGISYYYYEYNSSKGKINSKNLIISMLSFIIAACPKPIYIAFILLLLLLPKEKFNNKESKIKFNISIISIFIMMMLTFALPIASGSYVADPRGGDTNVTEQIKLIISQPISFVRVFYENAIKSGTVKFLGEGGLTSYAYYGNINDKNIYIYIIILLCASIFIENGTKTKELKVSYKIFILSLILCITCMIWGSMYLIFTPVSGTIINGVQNRYFIPLIFPLLFLVNNNKIKNNFDESKKYIFYCLSLTWINIYSIIITLL